MWRITAILLIGSILAAAILGSAASIGALDADNLTSAVKNSESCDPDGVNISATAISGGDITSVKVSGIHDDCLNAVAVVQLENLGGTVIAAGQAAVSSLSGPANNNSVDVVPTTDGTGGGSLVLDADVAAKNPLVTGGPITINPGTLVVTIAP